MATIYLQLIQNRYMFRSFTVLQCSRQHCVQPVASDVEDRRIVLTAPVVLIVRMERSTACRISGTALKRIPPSGSFILGFKSKSQGHKSGEYGGWYSTSQPHRSNKSATACAACGRALSCKMMGGFCRKCRRFFLKAGRRLCSKN